VRPGSRLALALCTLFLAIGLDWRAASAASPASARPGLTGSYYGMVNRTLHTWEFTAAGAFLHQTAIKGAGTSVRTSERGRYEIVKDEVVLHVERSASGYATPGVGGRSTQVGGGAEAKSEMRRLSLQRRPGGEVVLDGVRLKPKTW
jgi:hypothetical protein